MIEHGRTAYRGGCRCRTCRDAEAGYQKRLRLRRARQELIAGVVDAAQAHAYLVELGAKGVGYRQAARLAGLSIAEIRAVRSGRRQHVRPETAACILAIRPVLAHGVYVSAWPTWRLIHSLRKEGYTLGALALKVGLLTPHLQFDHGQVTVKNALRMRQFYEQVNLEGGEEVAS